MTTTATTLPATGPDAASLDRLHDIIVPPPVPWWPPATGWIVLAIGVFVIAMIGTLWLTMRWHGNRYRRQANAELQRLAPSLTEPIQRAAAVVAIAQVLKRVALSIYSRDRVASLSGVEWVQFLNATCPAATFRGATENLLVRGPYDPRFAGTASADDVSNLLATARRWVAHHRSTLAKDEGVAAC